MGIVIWWMSRRECEQMNMSKLARLIFLWNILFTHGIEYFMMWKNILPHVHGWNIKWMKNYNGWNMNKKKDEGNFFTTKNYVSIQILPLHNRDVCVNQNTTCSSPKIMFPLGIETIWGHTFFVPFWPIFYLNSIFQTCYV
jgi:hypothetical protein